MPISVCISIIKVILDKDPSVQGKKVYPFLGSNGSTFKFNENCPGVCKYCKLFAGFHSLPLEDYYSVSMDVLGGGEQKPHQFTNHVEFALVQLFFDIFLVQSKKEFLEITLHTVCRFLVSKRIDPRVGSCFFLYLDFLVERQKEMATLLLAIDFVDYLSDFLAEFMQNFELMSFKDSMAGKFEGNIEALVKSDNKLQIKSIMQPFDGRSGEKNRTIKLKDRDGVDETTIDFSKKIIYNDCIWDSEARRFKFLQVLLTPGNWKQIREYNQDKDLGYFTYYFWRLHSMHHLLSIFSAILSQSRGKGREGLFKRIGQLPLQVIEVSVLFKDYSQFFVPREPFLIDSECWNEIKGMSSEFIGVLMRILLSMISKDNPLLLKTVSICSRNSKYIGGLLDIMGRLNTLSSTSVLLKNLLMISEEMLEKDPDNIDFIPSDAIKFTNNLVEEIKNAHQRAQTIFQKNIELEERSQYFNEKALTITLEFALLSLQSLNVIGIEELLLEDDKESIPRLVLPILSFNEKSLETVLAVERKIQKFRQASNSIMDYPEFVRKYCSIIPLFFWWVSSSSKENCDVISTLI